VLITLQAWLAIVVSYLAHRASKTVPDPYPSPTSSAKNEHFRGVKKGEVKNEVSEVSDYCGYTHVGMKERNFSMCI